MSRSRKDFWGDPIEFEGGLPHEHDWEPVAHFIASDDEGNEPAKYLEEAHEALSKLMNKTSKRAKGPRPGKRNEAWH